MLSIKIKKAISFLTSKKNLPAILSLFLLLVILPTSLALVKISHDLREKAAEPASYPPSYPPPSPSPLKNPILWKTAYALLRADDFYIIANGQKYLANTGHLKRLTSDPGSLNYTTLEVEWQEHGKEMRLYIYFYADVKEWWISEIRTYNGQTPGNWLYYQGPFFKTPRGHSFHDVEYTLTANSSNPDQGQVYFKNFYVQPFFKESPSPSPTLTPVPSLAPTPTCVPEGKTAVVHPQAPQCCEGLTSLSIITPDEKSNCSPPLLGSVLCSKCPNKICEKWENYCNCPEDCPEETSTPSPVNHPPQIKTQIKPDQTITLYQNQKRSYVISVSDSDNHQVKLSLVRPPQFASLKKTQIKNRYRLTISPTRKNKTGKYTLTLRAVDSGTPPAQTSLSFKVAVKRQLPFCERFPYLPWCRRPTPTPTPQPFPSPSPFPLPFCNRLPFLPWCR